MMSNWLQPLRLAAMSIVLIFCFVPFIFAAGNSKKEDADLDYKTLGWDELLPQDELEMLYDSSAVDHTPVSDEQLSIDLEKAIEQANIDLGNEVTPILGSTKIIEELDGKAVRVPGFIVPLEFNEKQHVTQFFLVPYFGACIHVPPPPPNQIIYMESKEGIKVSSIYDPFWISGVLKTTLTENDVATSAYSMQVSDVEEYTAEYEE